MRHSVIVAILLLFSLSELGHAEQGFSGTIVFRGGQLVEFNYLGGEQGPGRSKIDGTLGAQKLEVQLREIKEVHFSDPNEKYNDSRNPRNAVLVINKAGKRFTLTHVDFNGGHCSGCMNYSYNDLITGAVKLARTFIKKKVSHIIVGDASGTLRVNRRSGEFFPSQYNFDPFTGDKLEWATPPN